MSGSGSAAERLAMVLDAWVEHLRDARKSSTGYKPRYVYASSRRRCVREMALDLTNRDDREGWSDETLERFATGDEREDDILARLQRIGKRATIPFKVTNQQVRFEITDTRDGIAGPVVIVGKVDAIIEFDDGLKIPCEIKSGDSVRYASGIADLDSSDFTRSRVDQLLIYCYATNSPWGFFILDRMGLPAMVPVYLEDHLDRCESFIREARAAVDYRFERGPIPPFTDDASLCRRCSHYDKSCHPADVDFGEGAKVILDPLLIEAAKEREKNAEAARVYQRADKRLKAALRGVPLAIVGDYRATGTWVSRKVYDVPGWIRKLNEKTIDRGSFRVTIKRAESASEEES